MIDKLAKVLEYDVVSAIAADDDGILRLSNPGSLVDEAKASAGLTDDEAAYLADIPPVLLESMRAAIVEAVKANQAIHVQYSPAYDFSVRIWDYGQAVSIHVTGPYPPDYSRNSWNASS
ncbi:MAG TPA: hypothetical protein VMW08_10590 [Acidimicrobiales bacterium]|nr:hypothetical protein [Acidimicrobiales bacterium]